MYEYHTPPGVGDYFFQYVYDAQGQGLVDGMDYNQLGIKVNNGQFISRYWSGLSWLADSLSIYDYLNTRRSSSPMQLGQTAKLYPVNRWAQMGITPEMVYPDNGNIRFDLGNVHQNVAGTDGGLTIYESQLVFSGVRRLAGVVSDPVKSPYKYYEKPYYITYDLVINNYASLNGVFLPPVRRQILIDDYDFELRRIDMYADPVDPMVPVIPTWFKMVLYDANKVQRSNAPVLANLLCHTNNYPGIDATNLNAVNQGELNFWPSPPILYPVRSVLAMDIYSLVVSPTVLPITVKLMFSGVRRIPCI